MEEVEPVVVVGAGAFDVFGAAEAGFADGAEGSGEHGEIDGDDGGGASGELQEIFGGSVGGGFAPVAFADECGAGFNAMAAHGLFPAIDAFGDGRQRMVAEEHGDVAVALGDEMVEDELGALGVIGGDGIGGEALREAADEDDGAAGFDHAADLGLVTGGDVDEQAVDEFGAEDAEVAGLFFDVVVGAAEDEGVAFAAEGIFDALDDGGIEGVADVGDQHADGLGVAGLEAAGDGVGGVVEIEHGLLDPGGEFRADEGRFVDDGADGVGGDAGAFGDVVDSRHSSWHYSEVGDF